MAGAFELAADAARAGFRPFLSLLISLNISLAVLNMLPMLPLDGGHVAIALYERIRTRKGGPRYRADVAKLMPVVYAFMAFLLLFVASQDVPRLRPRGHQPLPLGPPRTPRHGRMAVMDVSRDPARAAPA